MHNSLYKAVQRFYEAPDRKHGPKHVRESMELTDAQGRRYRLELLEDVEPDTAKSLWHDELEEDG